MVEIILNDLNRRTICDLPTASNYSISSREPIDSLSQFANVAANVTSLRLELNDLQHRYDSLLEAKENAAARYKKDYKKWRDFKKEFHEQLTRDNTRGFRSVRQSMKRKRCDFPESSSQADQDMELNGTYGLCFFYPSHSLCLS